MSAEHAVGRAPAGAPVPVGVPRPSAPTTAWPARATAHESATIGDARSASAAPASAPSSSATASGAVPVVPRRKPRLPLSVLLVALAVVLVVVCALVLGTRAGAGLLTVQLLICAVVRAVRPAPGPNALAVRSRALDVLTLAGLAVVLGALALVLPGAR